MSKGNFVKIVGLSNIDLSLVLSFHKEELNEFKLSENLEEINDVASVLKLLKENSNHLSTIERDLANKENADDNKDSTTIPNVEILDRLRIDSNNFLINNSLFINKAFKEKVFVEIITLEEPKFEQEFSLFQNMFKYVTEQNFIFFVESNVVSAHTSIKFVIKVLKNDVVINSKEFIINSNKNDQDNFNNKEENKETLEHNELTNNNNKSNTSVSNKVRKSKISNSNSPRRPKDNFYDKLHYDFSGTGFFMLDLSNLLNIEAIKFNNRKTNLENSTNDDNKNQYNNNENSDDKQQNANPNNLEYSTIKEKQSSSVNEEQLFQLINKTLKKSLDLILYLFYNFPKTKKIISLPHLSDNILSTFSSESVFLIRDILSYADVFFLEKELAELLIELLSIENANKVDKKNTDLTLVKLLKPVYTKFPRLCLMNDNFDILHVIEQQPDTSLLLAHTQFNFSLFPGKENFHNFHDTQNSIGSKQTAQTGFSQTNRSKRLNMTNNEAIMKIYNLTLKNNYFYLESIFFGGFLSRLVHQKSFKTCFIAGNDSVKRVLEVLKLGVDLPNDVNYYLIRVPYKKKRSDSQAKNNPIFGNTKSSLDPITLNKESNFILDCANINDCRMRHYNPLYDQSLSTFFSGITVRTHLKKLGFINKKGEILQDPDRKRLSNIKSKKLINAYEQEELKLQSIKENNIKMKLQIKNLFSGTIKNFQEVPLKELEKVTQVRNFKPISKQKLPSIPNYLNELSPKTNLFVKNSHIDLYAKSVAKNAKFNPLSKNINNTKKSPVKFDGIANSNIPKSLSSNSNNNVAANLDENEKQKSSEENNLNKQLGEKCK